MNIKEISHYVDGTVNEAAGIGGYRWFIEKLSRDQDQNIKQAPTCLSKLRNIATHAGGVLYGAFEVAFPLTEVVVRNHIDARYNSDYSVGGLRDYLISVPEDLLLNIIPPIVTALSVYMVNSDRQVNPVDILARVAALKYTGNIYFQHLQSENRNRGNHIK